MAAYDPYAIEPNWQGQGNDTVTAWQQALAKLNLQKGQTMQKYGFSNQGDFSIGSQGDVVTNPDGTTSQVNLHGGMQGVDNFSQFAGLDNKTGYGGFRNELQAEANAMDKADNTPSRGFSGGLANQAAAAAQQAVLASQNQFTSGYNQFVGGFNTAGQQATGTTNLNLGNILSNQGDWRSQQAAWLSTIPTDATYTSGVSGGGSTPIGATSNPGGLVRNNAIPQGPYVRKGSETTTSGKTFSGIGGRGHIT